MSEDEEEEVEMEEEDDTDVGSVKFEMEEDPADNGADVIDLDSESDEVVIEKQVQEVQDEGVDLIEVQKNGERSKKEEGTSDKKSEEGIENRKNEKKKKKKKHITDEDHFAEVASKEMKYLKKHLISERELDTQTIVCTACFKQVNYKQEGAVMRHPDLAVPVCRKCHKFYFNGEWMKDEEGFYEHCRWCANGGELLCCDNCPNAFCKKCIKRNLGRSKVSEIEAAEEWRCLACEPGQVAKLRALYFSIWTYNVKMAMAEEEKVKGKEKKEEEAKEKEKLKKKSSFVDEAHKDGFEVTKILTNYLQKSQKGWKDKSSGAESEPDKEDVKKLVVKFRTIIKVAHHNLDQLEKNLVEGCLSAYPEITEDMLEAKTIPVQQNGTMKKESSDNETKNADKKKKPAKKAPVVSEVVKEEDREEKKKAQQELREKRKEERDCKRDIKNEADEENGDVEEAEEALVNGDVVKAPKKNKKQTSNPEEDGASEKQQKKVKAEKAALSSEEDKAKEPKAETNGNSAGSPNESKDMFEDTYNDEPDEVEKNSSLGLDEANKVARACLLETSSDEDTVQKNSGLDKPKDRLKETDSDSTLKEPALNKEENGEKKVKVKSVKDINQSDDDAVKSSPKKKLKTKKELDNLKRLSDEAKENGNSEELENGPDKKSTEKEKKKPVNRKKAPVFSSSDSDDSDEYNLGIIGQSPERKKKMTKKEEEKEKEREEKKILERERLKQERKQKKKEQILNGTYEEKRKKRKSKDQKGTSDDENKAEHKLLRKKVGKQLKKLRKKVEDIDVNNDPLLKQNVKADVAGLGDHIKGELQEEGFIDVSCHPDLYSGRVEADEWDLDIERLCNFDTLRAKKKASKESSENDDEQEEKEGKQKSKGEKKKKEKEKEKGLGEMSSGSEGERSDGDSEAEPKNICASTPQKNEIAKAQVLDSSDSCSGEESEGSATEDDGKSEKKVKSKKERKESKREKNKGDDEGDSDGGSDGQAKKAKKKNLDILAMKLDESDSSEEEGTKKKKGPDNAGDSSDSSDFGKMSAATLYGSAKKKEFTKKRKRALASDDDSDHKGNDDDPDDLSSDDDSEEEEAPKKKETKKRGKKKKSSSSEDSDEADRPKKKRKRIKKGSDESDDEEEEKSPTKRHDIKRVIKDKNLADETKTAAAVEKERRERMKERQEKYNEMFGKHSDREKDAAIEECVLDFNEETKEILVEVDKRLVKKLKPHQVDGIKFMWDCCFESLAQIKAKKIPGGAILAHCMGLGKTLQSVAMIHTVMSNPKVKVDRTMVICPVNVVKNWADEFGEFTK